MSLVEIILISLLSLITLSVLIVSWQVFFFFKDLRRTQQKADQVLAKLELASHRLMMPAADLSLIWRFLTHSGRLFKLIDRLLDKDSSHASKQK